MELSLILAKQIASMFLMMAIGVIVVRVKLLKSSDGLVISKLLLYAVIPCTILKSYQMDYSAEKLTGFLIAIGAAILAHGVFLLMERILRRPLKLRPIESASFIYCNAGNLIIPLVTASLGSEWVFYASGYMMVQLFFMWTHGKCLISHEKSSDIKKILANINIIAIFVGMIFFVTGVRFTGIIASTVDSMSSMLAPMSMVLTGMILGGMKFKDIISVPRAYMVCTLRLILCPIVMIAIFALSGITGIHPDAVKILLVTTLACGSSAATTVTQFAQLYNDEPGYAGTINILSVLFCIVTIPTMIYIYQLLI